MRFQTGLTNNLSQRKGLAHAPTTRLEKHTEKPGPSSCSSAWFCRLHSPFLRRLFVVPSAASSAMHVFYLINSALFAVGYAKVLVLSRTSQFADPTITEAPQIDLELLRRQNSDRFIGWLQDSNSWDSRQCVTGLTYFQSNTRWACCTTTSTGCDLRTLPIGCITGSLIYSLISATGTQQRTTIACTSIWNDPTDRSLTVCNTAYVYEYLQDKDPATRIVCGDTGENRSYYRQQPAGIVTGTSTFNP